MLKGLFYVLFPQEKLYHQSNYEEYEYLSGDVIEYGRENKISPNPNDFYIWEFNCSWELIKVIKSLLYLKQPYK